MIAEKTADAIRGRKLTPFEPPTRILTDTRYPTNTHVPPANVYYKSPKPNAKQHGVSLATMQQHHHQPQRALPPPLDQQQYLFANLNRESDHGDWSVASADSDSHYAGSSDRSITELANSTFSNSLDQFSLEGRSGQSSGNGKKTTTKQPTRQQKSDQKTHHEFMLKHYAGSAMVDNLIKKLGSIR